MLAAPPFRLEPIAPHCLFQHAAALDVNLTMLRSTVLPSTGCEEEAMTHGMASLQARALWLPPAALNLSGPTSQQATATPPSAL